MQQTLFEIQGIKQPQEVGGQVQRLVMRFPDYKPYKGFYNLRCFNMPFKIFKKLWCIQDTLYEMNQNKEYYKKWHPAQWQKAQLLSAEYQQILFQYAHNGKAQRPVEEVATLIGG